MQKPSITALAAVFIWMLCSCPWANAGDSAKQASTMPDTLTYLHLYTDPDGMSHFRDEKFEFHIVNRDDSLPGLSFHDLDGAKSASLVKLQKGVVEDWHTAPRKQFAVVIQGVVELTAGDGEVRRLTVGHVALLDDTSGKGHKTAALGEKDHIALMIPVK